MLKVNSGKENKSSKDQTSAQKEPPKLLAKLILLITFHLKNVIIIGKRIDLL